MLILSELATDFDLDEIEEFITDPTVSDVAKLTISPLLKELNSELADEGIIEYLNDPATAMQQMQSRILELVDQGEMGVQTILTDIIEMPLDRRLSFVEWLGDSGDPRAVSLLLPMLEGQTGKVVASVLDALEQLGAVATPRAIPALNAFIATTSNRQFKQQARAVLGRLTMYSVPGSDKTTLEEDAPSYQLPRHEACASFVDGSGAQLIMLTWKRPDGLLKVFHVFMQDQWGIKDCYGVDEVSQEHWDELVSSIRQKSFGCAIIPFNYAQSLVAEARALSKRTKHKLPIAYFVWRPLLDEVLDSKQQRPPTALPVVPFDDTRRTLAQRGGKLYDLIEFTSWMYEPLQRVEPYINRYWFGPTLARASKRATGKSKNTLPQERATLLETLTTEALQELVDAQWCLLYEARLRRQASLFQQIGRTHDAELCSAVASMLHPDSQVPFQEQPFLRQMMHFTLEQGPMRVMAENLEAMGVDFPAFPNM